MSDESTLKFRVIDWNPSASAEAAAATSGRRQSRALLIVTGISVLVTVLALAGAWWLWSQKDAGSLSGSMFSSATPNEPLFVSRARAEFARETASTALGELRKLPLNHPRLLQDLTLLEKSFLVSERLLAGGNYSEAQQGYDQVNAQIEDFTRVVTARKEATARYDELLGRLQLTERVRQFAPELYETAYTGTGEGRMLLEGGSFLAAQQAFEGAVQALDTFEQRRAGFIDDRLWEGQQALADGRRGPAEDAFRAVLQYDAGNEAALRGLRRAETIERVHTLLETARSAEERQDYATAIPAYREAFQLDGLSIVAQQGEARATQLQQDARFETLVTAAREAEASLDWAGAVARYEEALVVYPKKDDIKAALQAAKESHHQAQVRQALATAYERERAYDWPGARDAYLHLLSLEPEHADGVEGMVRVGRVTRALLEYDKLLEITEQQLEAAQFQAAITTFNSAMQLKPAYLPLTEEVVQLRAALDLNNQPVEVKFRSDGRTWVSISGFRLLGRMKETAVKLPPGDYEVIGRRKKYQDVAMLLRVRPDMKTREVTVVCDARASK